MSELRCRPGDIAFVVNDSECPENNGALVEVLCRAEDWYWDLRPHWVVRSIGRPLKLVDCDSEDAPTGLYVYGMKAEQPDDELRPIRPGEGEDEILTLAGKPQEVAA